MTDVQNLLGEEDKSVLVPRQRKVAGHFSVWLAGLL
jgi:hypothetical protein